jgi:hypothetical protein
MPFGRERELAALYRKLISIKEERQYRYRTIYFGLLDEDQNGLCR